jgi:hypothetical protein
LIIALLLYREVKGGTFARFGIHPNPAAVSLNDTIAERQPDAGILVLLSGMRPPLPSLNIFHIREKLFSNTFIRFIHIDIV